MTDAGYPRLLCSMAAGVVLALGLRRIVRVEVQGASMIPTLEPGDRLVAVAGWRPRPGDIVAVHDPRRPERLLVKRVTAVQSDGRYCLRGDNPGASTDSRTFGAVAPKLVAGRVVWRYGPRPRRGPIGHPEPVG